MPAAHTVLTITEIIWDKYKFPKPERVKQPQRNVQTRLLKRTGLSSTKGCHNQRGQEGVAGATGSFGFAARGNEALHHSPHLSTASLTSAKNQPLHRFNKGQTVLSKTTCGNQLHISLTPLQMNDKSRGDLILIHCVACLSKSKGCLTADVPQGFYTHHM